MKRVANLFVILSSINYIDLNIDIIDIKRYITNDISYWILCSLQLHPDVEQLRRLWHNCLLMFMAFGCWSCDECVDSWRPKTQAEKKLVVAAIVVQAEHKKIYELHL